jgi:glutathione-regulated potassium-efflux system ancillary protein KefC
VDFHWVTIALGDVSWISLAFIMGFLANMAKLPPLVGFLATGFILNYLGIDSGSTLQKLADLGITLMLFTVGLKLNLKMLIRPQIWAVTVLHISLVIAIFGAVIFSMALLGISLFAGLDLKLSMMKIFWT